MILYCDSSALVKKYLAEQDSERVIQCISRAQYIVLSVIGYAEVHSAFSRKRMANELSKSVHQKIIRVFEDDWIAFVKVRLTEEVNHIVRLLLSRHSIRAFDALHIASAILVKRRLKKDIHFLSFDQRQNDAARFERLILDFD